MSHRSLLALCLGVVAVAALLSAAGCSTTSRGDPTSTRTPSNSPTITRTHTRTQTHTRTSTASNSVTPTFTITRTFTISNTITETRTRTHTRTATETRTITETPTDTCIPGTCSVTPTPACATGCVPTITNLSTITYATMLTVTTSWQTISGSYAAQEGIQYELCVAAGFTYEFTFCSTGGGSYSSDPYLWLGDSSCQFVAANDDSCGLGSYLTWPATFTSPAVLVVTSCCTGSSSGTYTLAYRYY